MPRKYEVLDTKLEIGFPIYVYAYQVVEISDPVEIIYEYGVFEQKTMPVRDPKNFWSVIPGERKFKETFYDVQLDDDSNVRICEEFAKNLKIGDLVFYNISVDEYTPFVPDTFPVRIRLVS